MAAITAAIQTIAEAGDNVVAASQLYGGSYNLLAHTLPQQGIETRFFSIDEPQSVGRLADGRPRRCSSSRSAIRPDASPTSPGWRRRRTTRACR